MAHHHQLPADLDDESEAEDDRDLILGGEDPENVSDADLDALLEDANRLIGRPASSGRKRAKTGTGRHIFRGAEADDDEEDVVADYMYKDFWGSDAKVKQSKKRGALYVAAVVVCNLHSLDVLALANLFDKIRRSAQLGEGLPAKGAGA